eukprot:Selendium_serpulae@DN2826_c0_g1_i1.p2
MFCQAVHIFKAERPPASSCHVPPLQSAATRVMGWQSVDFEACRACPHNCEWPTPPLRNPQLEDRDAIPAKDIPWEAAGRIQGTETFLRCQLGTKIWDPMYSALI